MCGSVTVPNDPLEIRDVDACTWAAVLFFAIPALPLLIAGGAVCLAVRWTARKLRIPVVGYPTQSV